MIERTLTMSFKDIGGYKHSISIKDIKEDVLENDALAIMENIVNNKLVKTVYGDLVEKTSAQVVTKETEVFTV